MVTGGGCLAYHCATLGAQPGQKDRSLHLSAHYRGRILDSPQLAALYDQGRILILIAAMDLGAHVLQRVYDPAHGAADQGVVAREHREKGQGSENS